LHCTTLGSPHRNAKDEIDNAVLLLHGTTGMGKSMDYSTFRASLDASSPPAGVSPLLRALWLDAKGDFDGAHAIAQDTDDAEGARVHAYLHRKEGDLGNAGYWYRRARVSPAEGALEAEWEALVRRFLAGPR
jgi:hypothetical protein